MLSDINISQGNVATPLRCDGICNDLFIAHFLASVTVKEFLKSVIIWLSYGQEFDVLFFDSWCSKLTSIHRESIN